MGNHGFFVWVMYLDFAGVGAIQKFAEKFYKGGAWKRCRKAFVQWRVSVDGGMCQFCQKELGKIVHHIEWLTPENIGNPDVTLNFDNLAFACDACHNRIKDPAKAKKRYRFDADGRMIVPPSGD